MLKGFRDFVFRGNIVDLAVAFVIGLAFAALVQTFVGAIVKPIINAFPGANTNGWGFSLRGGDLKPKTFIDISTLINAVIVFGLTAAIIYFILVLPNEKLRARRGQPEVPPTDVDLLAEIRDLLRAQQTGGRAEA
ncbi:MAG TPA: MscL family protein [Jatrophihabitantaceae bacterium]|jgi:large conductance mechanosensitive channel